VPKSGDVIAERYRLVSLLAEGGMGAVWRAEHLELGVEVALKVLLERAHTPSAERRFRQEAQSAARLRSPHVVQVQDFGVVDGQPFLVMELLAGEDLAARIADRGPLAPHDCATILDGVATAIQLAHDNGIIHRDLKPANIFLAKVGGAEVVKVLDFGIAKIDGAPTHGSSTTGAGLVGSPAYMSPEQVWAETLTSATDLWSLGVVAFEMLVAHNPFDDGPLARVFQRIVTDEIPRARDLRPGLPSAFDAFFERALARDPKQRYASAVAFAAAFRGACATESASSGRSAPIVAATLPRSESQGSMRGPSESIGTAATMRVDDSGPTLAPRKGVRGAFVGATAFFLAVGVMILWSTTRSAPREVTSAGPSALSPARENADPKVRSVTEPSAASAPSTAPPASGYATASAPMPPASAAPIARSKAAPPRASSPPSQTAGKEPEPPPRPTSTPAGVDPFFGIPRQGH